MPLINLQTYQRGLKYVYQLFENQQFKTDEQVWEEYGLSVLRYNALKVALPKDWKTFFLETPRGMYSPLPPQSYDATLRVQNLSRLVYNYIQEDRMILQKKYLSWKKDLGENFCETLSDYTDQFSRIYSTTNVPKYRSFQYRLLQRGIITNIHLCKWGLVDSNLCSLCQLVVESPAHLLFECTYVKGIWEEAERIMRQRIGNRDMRLNTVNVIFDSVTPKKGHIVNFICLVVKQYIYRQRCLNEPLSEHEIWNLIYKI